MKTIKKISLLVLTAFCMLAFVLGASTISASAASSDMQFVGTSIRMVDPVGIRFTASFSDGIIEELCNVEENGTITSYKNDGDTFGMVVVPAKALKNATGDIINYICTNYNKQKTDISTEFNVNQIYFEEGEYRANGVIHTISDKNFNLDYQAVAYYIQGGEYVYSDLSDAYSIVEVADLLLQKEEVEDDANILTNIVNKSLGLNYDNIAVSGFAGDIIDLKQAFFSNITAQDFAITCEDQVVSIDGNVVTLVGAGQTTLTVSAYDGKFTMQVPVSVKSVAEIAKKVEQKASGEAILSLTQANFEDLGVTYNDELVIAGLEGTSSTIATVGEVDEVYFYDGTEFTPTNVSETGFTIDKIVENGVPAIIINNPYRLITYRVGNEVFASPMYIHNYAMHTKDEFNTYFASVINAGTAISGKSFALTADINVEGVTIKGTSDGSTGVTHQCDFYGYGHSITGLTVENAMFYRVSGSFNKVAFKQATCISNVPWVGFLARNTWDSMKIEDCYFDVNYTNSASKFIGAVINTVSAGTTKVSNTLVEVSSDGTPTHYSAVVWTNNGTLTINNTYAITGSGSSFTWNYFLWKNGTGASHTIDGGNGWGSVYANWQAVANTGATITNPFWSSLYSAN